MTAQVHEKLIFEGEERTMAFCPPIPENRHRCFGLPPLTTACWRGYVGTWEINNGLFYLVAINEQFCLPDGEPILADWFSGTLRIPKGDILQYVHMGFGSVYEQEEHVKIEKGVVVATRIIDNRGKMHDRWELGWKNLPGSENRFPGDDEV